MAVIDVYRVLQLIVLAAFVPNVVAFPLLQKITALSNDQIEAFRPFTHYAKNCIANPKFTPVDADGDGAGVQFWYVGYDASLKTVVVGHQGTDPSSPQAVITDLELVPVSLNSTLFADLSTSIKVHSGFKREHAKTANPVLKAVKLAMKKYSTKDVAVVGHSLGGALALLDSVYLAIQLPSTTKIRMFGYGMPRVGNEAFAQFVDQHAMITHTHINNRKDPVPVMPGKFLGYQHCHGEVHIKEDGEWVSCPGHDNPSEQCSVGDVRFLWQASIKDHSGPYDGIHMGNDC